VQYVTEKRGVEVKVHLFANCTLGEVRRHICAPVTVPLVKDARYLSGRR
jgi:hypothetical protein